ncbi:uncharacterized protein [Amphiura filiformis]|uniref:uncharacterized protein n=1 Tax=Amphiura filiformis TaxID=82378 RepID=UPI003B2103BC
MRVELTQHRKQELKQRCQELLHMHKSHIRQVAKVIGKLVAAFPGVDYGPLHYRELEKEKSMALKISKGNFDSKMILSDKARAELVWWIQNIDTAYRCINHGVPIIRLQSDASGLGWGGTDGTTHIGGRWGPEETVKAANNEINYLELLAAFLTMKAFCKNMQHVHVQIQLDNTTAVAYIAHMGGTKSEDCNALAKVVWAWCQERQIWLSVAHLPGIHNVIADRKSRHFDDQTEWMLDKGIFQRLCALLGKPEIDLFASRLNAQVHRYVSWKPDPTAESADAFAVNWGKMQFYAFPPFCLISKCLQKIVQERATGIMIVPKWPTQVWFPKLMSMLVEEPIILPRTKNLLVQPVSNVCHPLHNKLVLLACRLSGDAMKIKDFQKKLRTLSPLHGESPLRNNIKYTLTNGWSFVTGGKLILCKQMSYKC